MTKSRDIQMKTDISDILADPSSIYDEPMDVVQDDRLSHADKRRILEEWRLDANELQVAEDEGMGGGEPDMMNRVQAALDRLDPTHA